LVELGSRDVWMVIGNQAGEMLADSSAHDTGLAVIHGEAFLEHDGGGV